MDQLPDNRDRRPVQGVPARLEQHPNFRNAGITFGPTKSSAVARSHCRTPGCMRGFLRLNDKKNGRRRRRASEPLPRRRSSGRICRFTRTSTSANDAGGENLWRHYRHWSCPNRTRDRPDPDEAKITPSLWRTQATGPSGDRVLWVSVGLKGMSIRFRARRADGDFFTLPLNPNGWATVWWTLRRTTGQNYLLWCRNQF